MTTPSHRDAALNHLAASRSARDQLADLYRNTVHIDRGVVADLHESVRIGVKMAQVEALLALEATVSRAVDVLTAGER